MMGEGYMALRNTVFRWKGKAHGGGNRRHGSGGTPPGLICKHGAVGNPRLLVREHERSAGARDGMPACGPVAAAAGRAMHGWESNPRVWAIGFGRISREEAELCWGR